ncbi:FecCD family ABC transporter permease [Mongoliimonas terrestris]|uniref:FecCD family ABC transporter permease n=1 Tax=Mongoliimonas terrestris TaxID=1709001 RepID=UPI00094989BF|nr:iron ABC transporter permease [Mongoliimonas terrestris]
MTEVAALRRLRPSGDRTGRALAVTAGTLLLALAAGVLSVSSGPTGVGLGDLLTYLTEGAAAVGDRERLVLEAIRLPRAMLGALVGAALAVSGAMMQGLFRNPLADPGLVGVSSGAATAAVVVIVLGAGVLGPLAALLGVHLLPIAAFLGALVNTLVLYRLATAKGRTSTATLVLAGIAVGALSGAVTGLMVFGASDAQLRDFTFWSLGSLGGATPARILAILPFIAVVFLAIPFVARGLDALVLGEAEAHHMGVPVQTLKRVVIVCVAAASGATVAVTGTIGFVGIVVPHLIRLAIGPGHRFLLPASAFAGAALLLLADTAARLVVAPAELPIGIVTALFGAPVFLAILINHRNGPLSGE